EGSNNGTDFTLISSGTLSLPEARNAAGFLIDPLTLALQEVRFPNAIPYKTYRVLFPDVKDNATANSMQVGEVELLGTVATEAPANLSIQRDAAGTITITSPQPGTLQSATELTANTTWTEEGPIDGSVTITPTGEAKFYRVLVQQ